VKDLFAQAEGTSLDKSELGNIITSWNYKPPKSNKFLFSVLGVIGALVVFAMIYGGNVLPWIKRIPSILIYALIFLISPLLKYFTGFGKDQFWTLYEHGYSVRYEGKNGTGEERIGWWRDFSGCNYDSQGVKLIPASPLRKAVRMNTTTNVTEVYSIARERISMTRAQVLEKSVPAPARPRTKEQRHIQKIERRTRQEHSANNDVWKSFFGGDFSEPGK